MSEHVIPNKLSALKRHRADIAASTYANKTAAKVPCVNNTSPPPLLDIYEVVPLNARDLTSPRCSFEQQTPSVVARALKIGGAALVHTRRCQAISLAESIACTQVSEI